jgi:hypothetical protein
MKNALAEAEGWMVAHSGNKLERGWCHLHQCRYAAGQHVSLAEVAGVWACCDQQALYKVRHN